MRKFYLNREEDVSGVSGTGRIAEGVLLNNGWVALEWNSPHKCVEIWQSLAEMETVHGHGGKTQVIWLNED